MDKAVSTSERNHVLPNDVLGLWEFTVRELRHEIREVVPDRKFKWLLATCDKLEQSMCVIAGGKYDLHYTLYTE
jgi:hypothetical protein